MVVVVVDERRNLSGDRDLEPQRTNRGVKGLLEQGEAGCMAASSRIPLVQGLGELCTDQERCSSSKFRYWIYRAKLAERQRSGNKISIHLL